MARIVVGISGGVDSSVAALLLKRAGHEVIGVFMNNWEEVDGAGVCTAERDWADARDVCDAIGIPYYGVSFAKEYRERVFSHFLSEYRKGRTPNPDVLCNREIKFSSFLDFAKKAGAEKLATGHFAGVDCVNGRYRLLRAKDENKDQTYFLYMLGQRALSYACFPLRNLLKAEVRKIAQEASLPTFSKKDSTGVCFIGERDFKPFLMQYLPAQPGQIQTEDGTVVGTHDGLMYYTLGQRRGLGIGGGNGGRWFVVEKNLERNVLVVSQGDESRLYVGHATASALTWTSGSAPAMDGEPFPCQIRIRHRQPLQDAVIAIRGDRMHMEFAAKQRAVTGGQAAVVYRGEECLGGGTID
ncbi:MAG: tRNA 2-thiouridine(34) synthase MnmA [Christensenellales bacterium]|jgi:tRNA-specific 2-thiouridylase